MTEEPVVVGDWVRECVLGEGGFGVVSMWKNTTDNKVITVKKCRWGLEANLSARQKERWINEIEIMQRLNHANIVKFQTLPDLLKKELLKYNPSGLPLLSMEYCSKGDLRTSLSSPENCCGLLEMDVRYILADLLAGVSFLHSEGITHRDIKPENIVLQVSDTRQNNIVYKIIDLGYAKELNPKNTYASFVGTLQYLAPELLYSKTYSCSVDYWSLGVVAFEIICGVRPILHNKSPAQWMLHIEQKTFDDICLYETADGKIKFSKEIFGENHISTYFKSEMEKWLRLALEFNPNKRGYKGNNRDKPDIFNDLKLLLNKKCITLFSVFTYKFLSYEIDDSTLFLTLQVWYERDTKISINDQIWLTKSCKHIVAGEEIYAKECFDKTYPNAMVYVFKKQEVQPKNIDPHMPHMSKLIFDSDLPKQPLNQIKLSFSHVLYFVYQENTLYNTLLLAWTTMIKYLSNNYKEMASICKGMNNATNIIIALEEFSQEVLDFDCKKCESLKTGVFVAKDSWMKSFNDIKLLIVKLSEAVKHIIVRFESSNRRILKIQTIFNNDYSPFVEHALNIVFDDTLKCYKESLKKASNKIISSSIRELSIYFFECLERRETILSNTDFHVNLRHILNILSEQKIIEAAIQSCLLELSKTKEKLYENHIERQATVWDLSCVKVEKADGQIDVVQVTNDLHLDHKNVNNEISVEQTSKQCNEAGEKKCEIDDPKSNQIYENVTGAILTDSENNVPNCTPFNNITNIEKSDRSARMFYSLPFISTNNVAFSLPASSLVEENIQLRYKVQDKTNESFVKYKSILHEALDFNFLNETI